MAKQREPGKFWPYVRPLIWQKAQELYQMEQTKMGDDFKGVTDAQRASGRRILLHG